MYQLNYTYLHIITDIWRVCLLVSDKSQNGNWLESLFLYAFMSIDQNKTKQVAGGIVRNNKNVCQFRYLNMGMFDLHRYPYNLFLSAILEVLKSDNRFCIRNVQVTLINKPQSKLMKF